MAESLKILSIHESKREACFRTEERSPYHRIRNLKDKDNKCFVSAFQLKKISSVTILIISLKPRKKI